MGHWKVPFACRVMEYAGASRRSWPQALAGPLAGFRRSSHSEQCPCRQDGRMIRGTGFGIGQIWTPTQLQLCVTSDTLLVLSEAPFPQLLNKNNAFLGGMLFFKHLAQCLGASRAPYKWELLSFSLCLGKSLLCLLSRLFPQIIGRPLSSSEKPGLHQRLWAGADRA